MEVNTSSFMQIVTKIEGFKMQKSDEVECNRSNGFRF